jgi:hypothetical protein
MNHSLIVYTQGFYKYEGSTIDEMWILGLFLARDVGLDKVNISTLRNWALANKNDPTSEFDYGTSGNVSYLEEDNDGNIHLIDATGSDPDDTSYIPTTIKFTKKQFIKLLDDWYEKVYKLKPTKIIITHHNNQFNIRTIS